MSISEFCEKCDLDVDGNDLKNFIEQNFYELLETYYKVISKEIINRIVNSLTNGQQIKRLTDGARELLILSQLMSLKDRYTLTVYPQKIMRDDQAEEEEA